MPPYVERVFKNWSSIFWKRKREKKIATTKPHTTNCTFRLVPLFQSGILLLTEKLDLPWSSVISSTVSVKKKGETAIATKPSICACIPPLVSNFEQKHWHAWKLDVIYKKKKHGTLATFFKRFSTKTCISVLQVS